jgi:hypothetical protein
MIGGIPENVDAGATSPTFGAVVPCDTLAGEDDESSGEVVPGKREYHLPMKSLPGAILLSRRHMPERAIVRLLGLC